MIRVFQYGCVNRTFIVKNPSKILFWKKLSINGGGSTQPTFTTYKEVNNG